MVRTPMQSRDKLTPIADGQGWAAVVERNSRFDGSFVYSVATTGVYCRPSCPSRPAKRINVRFHTTCAEAEAAGCLPCKRCQPTGDRSCEGPPQTSAKR